ncbi:GH22932 [Drosophila grimshawi]|uniref:Putative N(4)-(beta-N-acetylglucosaminyl)-L-asparaginase GH22932 n=2 Tax=Drosophila grimshawi TaxID=7222 RepID=ASPG1_DROGR|nr:RecName: Full=Putative N(4)-(beta-N-acetylglucosaminyl)-L-asparaginase GH22932; AltName: Full=Aspartylglucosaminidase; Short=AGA; AltName: Full=Glycosylasparaginase; AltName: Full=N4-(N-acetyl-beta-glucosaminyl)-L-asparagine amidase; Contains: RecName: Full=Glycosylasparaginase alpha chain; Contains: RecName: Full=Glycosylasparaginase beta chain; Flags: Precursor [Drosophila grimshawi]EDV98104.1 GH22932 [Drosophila grimshawi]
MPMVIHSTSASWGTALKPITNSSSDTITPNPNLITTSRGSSTRPSYITTLTAKKMEQLLPMVINTWNMSEANEMAWRILQQSEGGVRQTRNAVVEGVTRCEELQCFHSVGYGGSPDERGETTLDAMVMDGGLMDVGAVGGLRNIKEAIRVARFVLEHTSHTLLVGQSATDFAVSMGFRTSSLVTPWSHDEWEKWKAKNCQPNCWLNVNPDPKLSCGPYVPKATPLTRWKEDRARNEYEIGENNHDTIGMIAIDVENQIHTGTSTNGMTHKIPGRVGDSPIVGAGSYADNEVGAAVATGDGDVMMRFLPSLLAVEAMRNGKSPQEAAELGIKRIAKYYKDFIGAVIAVNRLGQYAAACYGIPEFPYMISNPTHTVSVQTVKCLPYVHVEPLPKS